MSDDDRSNASSDDDEEKDYLHCDGLPMSCTVDVNLADVMAGSSSDYTGTSVISYQVEEPTNCLIVHIDSKKVQVLSMKMLQGKHVLRPKIVYTIPRSGKAAPSSSSSSSSLRRPFRWALEEQSPKAKKRGEAPKKSTTAISLSEWKLPRLALSDDLQIIELSQPLSYCTVDLIFDFKSSVSEDHNGIWVSTTRAASSPVGTENASGGRSVVNLPQPGSLVATHFEVDHAHRCFPCVDLVYVRQTVQFNLTVPSNAYCRGNGGANTQATHAGLAGSAASTGLRKIQLPPSVRPIPFYVAGFIASTIPLFTAKETVKLPALPPLKRNNNNKKNNDDDDDDDDAEEEDGAAPEEEVECSVLITYDSQFMAELTLKTMIDAVKELRNFLGCPIDMPQLCLVALPKLILGGMENDGLIFIKESIGVNNRQQPGQGNRSPEAAVKELVRFVVHEVAHHWVGNRIGFSFSWKEGITLVLERYFGNVLLGLPANQGSKGGSSTGDETAAAAGGAEQTGSTALVAVDNGKELSGLTYHRAEAAMEAAVRKMGWEAFQTGMQRICRLPAGDVVADSDISSFFKI